MGGQVRLVHVTVLGDWLPACLAFCFGGGERAWGWGCSRVGAAPPLFVFLGWGACARDRAEGGRVSVSGLWPVGCARLGAPGARDRAGFWVRERGWVRLGAGARPSAWWGGAGECGRAFVCVRAGRGRVWAGGVCVRVFGG